MCQICSSDDQYFHEGLCTDCGDAQSGTLIGFGWLLGVLIVAAIVYFVHGQHAPKYDLVAVPLRRLVHDMKSLSERCGFIAKLKLAVAFTQVIASMDSTYNVGMPEMWFRSALNLRALTFQPCIDQHRWTFRWTAFLRFFGEIDWLGWIVPPECLVGKGMRQQLLLRTLAPLGVIVAMPMVGAGVAGARYLRRSVKPDSGVRVEQPARQLVGSVLLTGAFDWLPTSLVLAFCFTPSVSAQTFKAWFCKSYAFDDVEKHSFLAQEPSVRCGSDEHDEILSVAWLLVAAWPVGMIVLYSSLLVLCRLTSDSRHSALGLEEASESHLLYATSFLHRDYQPTL